MPGKEALSSSLGAVSTIDVQGEQADKYKDLFTGALGGGGQQSKQVEAAPQMPQAQVPIEKVKDLDRARRLLSSAIKLALKLSEARIKAETAFIAIEQIVDDDSAQAGVGQWRALVRKVEEIESLTFWLSNDADLSEPLRLSVQSSNQARQGADAKAQQIVRLLNPAGVAELEPSHMYAVSDAINELRRSLRDCAEVCGSESLSSVEQIGHRAESMLEQFELQREPSGQPTGEKRQAPEDEVHPLPPSTASGRKQSARSNGGEREQPSEGSEE